MPQQSKRKATLNLYCTPGERQAVHRLALDAGKPANQFVLDALGVAELRPAPGGGLEPVETADSTPAR